MHNLLLLIKNRKIPLSQTLEVCKHMAHGSVSVRLHLPAGWRDPSTCCRVDRQRFCGVQRNPSPRKRWDLRQIPASRIHQAQTVLRAGIQLCAWTHPSQEGHVDQFQRRTGEEWQGGWAEKPDHATDQKRWIAHEWDGPGERRYINYWTLQVEEDSSKVVRDFVTESNKESKEQTWAHRKQILLATNLFCLHVEKKRK